jgi:hypothetical protein
VTAAGLCDDAAVNVTLQYFAGCPNWHVADEHLKQALTACGHVDVLVEYQRVETAEEAERLGFTGSPTILVGGRDPFAVTAAPAGLACRVYATPEGIAGSPTIDQLIEVLS